MDGPIPTNAELNDFLINLYQEHQLQEVEKAILSHYKSKHGTTKNSNEKFNQKMSAVTPELFRSFLAEKGVHGQCISCGSNDLTTPETGTMNNDINTGDLLSDIEQYNRADSEERDNLILNNRIFKKHASYSSLVDINNPLYRMRCYFIVHCSNCGHLSLYRASTVLNWLEKKTIKDECNE